MKHTDLEKTDMAGLVDSLNEMGASLGDDERAVFAEMVACAAAESGEMLDGNAVEVSGGVNAASLYMKPVQVPAALRDLSLISEIKLF